MINTAGAYILILIFSGYNNKGGLAMHEFPSFESCQAAIVQIRDIGGLRGYCIAKETTNE